ncbi:tyrosine-protein phosphatase [Novosphingobium sp. TH158]|uniref:tyrosine-protein phosphatase n=1 Tax=Novosphingobium sp. TH158 TaxID=2067455 RepID=UPI000C7C4D17|nr:tyrosine-protein phosphatase [Novosphingobium sp. TH158]PLK26620.1 hypothetical protein C0V78_06770 [Novosphingobium sp. TH158]
MQSAIIRLALGALALATPQAIIAKSAAPAAQQAAQGRFIAIDGGRNFRDVGGYVTDSGKRVRWQRLYRSGSLGEISDKGRDQVAALKIAAIGDLRSTGERAGDRGDWLKQQRGYWSRDYDLAFGDLSKALSGPGGREPATVRAMMAQGYRKTIEELAPSYRQLFLQLAQGNRPVIVNCTAGKDRTGVATALVLSALGVPYATVRQDFLMSNNAPGMDGLRKGMASQAARLGGAMPPEVIDLLAGVDGAYIDAAFDQITADYGSVDGYLTKRLGLTRNQIAAVRRNMLR